MKLFYTEEEALKTSLIYDGQQEYFYCSYSVRDLDEPTPLMQIQGFFIKRQLYLRKEIKYKGKEVLIVYVLEQLKDEAIKIIMEAYNENRWYG